MVSRFLDALDGGSQFAGEVVFAARETGQEAVVADFPAGVSQRLRAVLEQRGIRSLYSHQAEATRCILSGRSTVVVTPTASGKSLCYNLPILSDLLAKPENDRPAALYLFPTKALSQDQVAELNGLVHGLQENEEGGRPLGAFTYDGDTPADLRRVLRERGDIIVTNPWMLHVAILPNHLRWGHFFRRLRYVVVDELHVYQGVFGSSVANLFRRLERIARHYGSELVFVGCSATMSRPDAHFERLMEVRPHVIDRSGAPRPERHHRFYNPPLLNEALGLRARVVDEVRTLARHLLAAGIPSIVFGRSRNTVEVLVKYLKDAAREVGVPQERVVGYRGGYLPLLRRRIEQGLRQGDIRLVVATNALELGVDIGSLDAVVMTGYPGTVASYRQQSGRAGRRSGAAVSVLVGSSLPLDQYVLAHPQFVLESSGADPVVNPDNLVIATNHLKCAAFELPFSSAGSFGRFLHAPEILEILAGPDGVLLARDGGYHWMDETYPAEGVSLDAVEMDTFLVLEEESHQSLGHVDRPSAMTTIHPAAIYQHQGEQFQIVRLDWEGRRAYARRALVDYYTEAETETDIQVLQEDGRRELQHGAFSGHGDVHVTRLATLYKRIRFYTNENLETGPIDLPPEEVDTTAFWVVFGPRIEELVRFRESTRAGAAEGLAHVLRGVAPLFLLLGQRDLRGQGFATHRHFDAGCVLLYDGVPAGVGLAEELYRVQGELFDAALSTVVSCPCRDGCPSCIGLGGNRGRPAKLATREILEVLRASFRSAGEPTTKKSLEMLA